jgi:hypothetical protein
MVLPSLPNRPSNQGGRADSKMLLAAFRRGRNTPEFGGDGKCWASRPRVFMYRDMCRCHRSAMPRTGNGALVNIARAKARNRSTLLLKLGPLLLPPASNGRRRQFGSALPDCPTIKLYREAVRRIDCSLVTYWEPDMTGMVNPGSRRHSRQNVEVPTILRDEGDAARWTKTQGHTLPCTAQIHALRRCARYQHRCR